MYRTVPIELLIIVACSGPAFFLVSVGYVPYFPEYKSHFLSRNLLEIFDMRLILRMRERGGGGGGGGLPSISVPARRV